MNTVRFILHNPHKLWYKIALSTFIQQTKAVDKYEYLFDYMYNSDRIIHVYLDGDNDSRKSFIGNVKSPRMKFYIWLLINKLNPFRFRVINNIAKLSSKDVLLTFLWDNFSNLSGMFDRDYLIENFRRTSAFKVVNLSHYGYNASVGSKNAKAADIDLFVSENNLARNSKFFQYYYSWYRNDVYVLPFVPKKRFVKTKKFEDRKNKAIAMGTITFPMVDNDFANFFKDDKLQPMRHEIYNNSENLRNCIDSYISHITDNQSSINITSCDGNNLSNKSYRVYLHKHIKKFKKIINIMSTAVRILMVVIGKKHVMNIGSKERQYYKFDIVQEYNDYRMFVCPEEIIDLPGIGFVEGMACGSAYIGVRDRMYSDLGLVDRVHYIGYDGTIKDLKEKIYYYQNHPNELEEIAERGHKFVVENFNEHNVCKKFFTDIEKLCLSKHRTMNIDF